ncbi:hypothetical protein J3R30DRAFT_2880072 [Lentinula aciculospora]|uniref:Uncharacterized protein n=1 Tax=Lentinula aciculospora TaxID=153920 RepID=A0A9W9AAF0_9AGAR|nr:hypothetical protein J3R30DRAFT_2880072 [Lentinula aciculospora]
MDVPLPSTRELELEMLLREKEGQVVQLSDEVSRLRLYLSTQPPPSTTEPVTLPPTFASLILPHISHLSQTADAAESSNSTTTAALTQRVRVLQNENDELYDILKRGETGRLKEEVQSLKRIVHKLEGALRESHQVIVTLSNELDKSYQAFTSSSAYRTGSPRNHHHSNGAKHPRSHSNSGGRLPPTGPRAYAHVHKKQRLSLADQDSHQNEVSPSMRSNVSLPSSAHLGNSGRRGRSRSRSRSPRGKSNVKMEVDTVQDEHQRRSPERVRDRERWDRDRERGGDRDRGRDRDRDGNRSRRNGGGRVGSRRGGGDKVSHPLNNASSNFSGGQSGSGSGDRTLAERMGLGV